MAVEVGRFYAGPAGNVTALPMIVPGTVEPTPVQYGALFRAIDGTPTKTSYGHRRTWVLQWNPQTEAELLTMGRIEGLYRGELRRRAFLLDTRRTNLLNPVVASCSDTAEFTTTSGTVAAVGYGSLHADLDEYFEGYLTWTSTDTNLVLTNPSFESGSTGWAGMGESTLSNQAGGASGGGSFFGRATSTTSSQPTGIINNGGFTPVVDGEAYTVTYWARASTTPTVRSGMDWFDAAAAYLTTTFVTGGVLVANTWTSFSATHTAPATAATCKPFVQTSANYTSGETLDVDNVVVLVRRSIRGTRKVPVISGSSYVYSAYVQSSGTVQPYLRFYDAYGLNPVVVLGSLTTPSTASRVSLSVASGSVPAGAAMFQAGIAAGTATAVSVAGLQVQIDAALAPYNPGAGSAEVIVSDYTAKYFDATSLAVSTTLNEV
jgi:hypothetical protein